MAGPGGFGLAILFRPGLVERMFRMPDQDPVTFSITGAVYLGFGLISLAGLIRPLLFSPILLLQLVYKLIWLGAITATLFAKGEFPFYAVAIFGIFLTYVIGDLLVLPYGYLLGNPALGKDRG